QWGGRCVVGDESAFLKAIAESPDDDGLRLVYADWLEEHGQDDRARYLREEVALTRIDGRSDPTAWRMRIDRLRRWREGLGQDWLDVIDRPPLIEREVYLS